MNHKEFFDILIGNPPPEVELEIEIKCREVKELPDFVIKDYCCDLVKQVRLQDMLIMAALVRISEVETKIYRYEDLNLEMYAFKSGTVSASIDLCYF